MLNCLCGHDEEVAILKKTPQKHYAGAGADRYCEGEAMRTKVEHDCSTDNISKPSGV